jgi:hypothetical protein
MSRPLGDRYMAIFISKRGFQLRDSGESRVEKQYFYDTLCERNTLCKFYRCKQYVYQSHEFGSNFPNNSVVSNRTIYHLMFQSPYVRNGTVRTINFTTLEVIHKNIFVVIMESGIFSSGALVLGILNWEVNANRA